MNKKLSKKKIHEVLFKGGVKEQFGKWNDEDLKLAAEVLLEELKIRGIWIMNKKQKRIRLKNLNKQQKIYLARKRAKVNAFIETLNTIFVFYLLFPQN